MHRLLDSKINDASITQPPHQWCINVWCIKINRWCIKMNRFGIMMHQNESIIITLVRVHRNPWAVSQICIKKGGGAPNGGLDYAPFFTLGPFARLFKKKNPQDPGVFLCFLLKMLYYETLFIWYKWNNRIMIKGASLNHYCHAFIYTLWFQVHQFQVWYYKQLTSFLLTIRIS